MGFPIVDSQYSVILTSVILWAGLYKSFLLFFSDRDPEFSSRIVTLIHGSTTALFGMQQCFLNELLFGDQSQTTAQTTLLIYSLGYFIFDVAWCLYYQTETKLMMFHHIFSTIAIYRVILKEYPGAQSACALGCMEVSNPLLQIRWYIRTFGYHHSPIFTAVEVMFVIVFACVRLFFGTFFTVMVVMHPYDTFEFKILCVGLYVISWMFMIQMFNYILQKYPNALGHQPSGEGENVVSRTAS